MSTALAQHHDDNVLITVTLSPTSALYNSPDGLAAVHPLITRLGRVGELQDVQLVSVPRDRWAQVQGDVLESLNGLPGVLRLEVHDTLKTRAKRGGVGDEL